MARTNMGTQGGSRMGQTPLQKSMTQVRIRCQILDGTRGTGIGLTLVMPIKRQLKEKRHGPAPGSHVHCLLEHGLAGRLRPGVRRRRRIRRRVRRRRRRRVTVVIKSLGREARGNEERAHLPSCAPCSSASLTIMQSIKSNAINKKGLNPCGRIVLPELSCAPLSFASLARFTIVK